MILSDFPQLQALSLREKLQLVDELWNDVAPDLSSLEVTQREKDMLDQRWAAFLDNPSSALTLEQFKERINALRA